MFRRIWAVLLLLKVIFGEALSALYGRKALRPTGLLKPLNGLGQNLGSELLLRSEQPEDAPCI
jgi:hypothetical protein